MNSISVKRIKPMLFRISVFIFAALPAFIIILSAVRWRPKYNAVALSNDLFPDAVFPQEAIAAYSLDGYDTSPNSTITPEGACADLAAASALPGEIAGAFYRAVRGNVGNSYGTAWNRPASGKDGGPPVSFGTESGGISSTGESGEEGRRLVGFIRDTEGVEYRYFKEEQSGKIIVVTNTPEGFPFDTSDTNDTEDTGNAEKEVL
jgi:hypothetical protein